tara:strand:- start:196 stop:456 length:261 start_codon:yes stop_codon:yes gene_type:complete
MDVNQLIKNVNIKIKKNINCEEVKIVDKTYLHKKHSTHQLGKFHFHITIKSNDLKKLNKVESSKKIFKILDQEMELYIHSLQLNII